MTQSFKVGAIVFRVREIEKSIAFYRDTMGLPVRVMPPEPGHDHEDGGKPWMMAQAGSVSLIFFSGQDRPGRTPVTVFELAEGGIDAVAESLAKRGATIVTPVSHAPGGWTFDLQDPDEHLLSFYQTKDKPR
jgi:glyoxylase I family protein